MILFYKDDYIKWQLNIYMLTFFFKYRLYSMYYDSKQRLKIYYFLYFNIPRQKICYGTMMIECSMTMENDLNVQNYEDVFVT